MKRRLLLSMTLGLYLMIANPVDAHHSFPGAYDTREQLILEGVANEFMFRNPHAFILLEVTDSDGELQTWYLELPPRWALVRGGITEQTIKEGDRLLVTCNPARDGGTSCGLGQRGGFYRMADEFLYGLDPRTVE